MSRKPLLALAALLAVGAAARASDPVGIYAVIDKVVVEPSTGDAERVQIWGVFAVAQSGKGDRYTPPARGYMSFTLPKDKQDVARKEWNDLKKLAGTKQVVAFGARYGVRATVRKGGDPTKKPDVYSLGYGVEKIPPGNYQAKILLAFLKQDKGTRDKPAPDGKKGK